MNQVSVTEKKLTAISLFSGVGGLDLGVTQAGFEIRVALEYERDAAESLRRNQFADARDRVIDRSIVDVPTAELLSRADLQVGDVDLVVGGPPCTPFSKSGYWLEYKRKGLDPNASLLDEFARVVRDAMPRAMLLENVHGLAYQNHNVAPFRRFVAQLEHHGYAWTAKVLNAADYGVPQLRKRLFIYATRDAVPPAHPQPTHSGWSETSTRVDTALLPYVTSGETLARFEGRDELSEPEEFVGGKYGHLLPEVPAGQNYLHFTERKGHVRPLFGWRTRYWTFLLKLDPDRPATTIQSQPGPYIGPFHWENRRLRLPEIKALQTFPDDYVVVGTRRSAQIQIGNAVPPALGAVVAQPLGDALRPSPELVLSIA